MVIVMKEMRVEGIEKRSLAIRCVVLCCVVLCCVVLCCVVLWHQYVAGDSLSNS